MPATLTTASSPPCSSTSSWNRPRTASPSVTDTDEARAEPPAATMRPAVVSSGSGSCSEPSRVTRGSTVTTNQPPRPSSSAMAAPIPPPPPVTTATC